MNKNLIRSLLIELLLIIFVVAIGFMTIKLEHDITVPIFFLFFGTIGNYAAYFERRE